MNCRRESALASVNLIERNHTLKWLAVASISALTGSLSACGVSHQSSGGASTSSFYVSTTGSDSWPGTAGHPFRTISYAVRKLRAGESLLVEPGTYREFLDEPIPPGIPTAPVTIRAVDFRQRPVLLSPHGSVPSCAGPICCRRQIHRYHRSTCFHGDAIHIEGRFERDIVIDGLVVNARYAQRNAIKLTGGVSHVVIEHTEIENAPNQGVLIGNTIPNRRPDSFDNLLMADNIHNNGRNRDDHGVYLDSPRNIVDDCRIHDNYGWGVHIFNGYKDANNPDDNVVVDNFIFRNGLPAGSEGAGIGLYRGRDLIAFDNVLWHNFFGIETGYGNTSSVVFNNTILGSVGAGIFVLPTGKSVEIANNIITESAGSGIWIDGPGVTARNNVLFRDTPDLLVDPSTRPKLRGNRAGSNPRLSCRDCADPKPLRGSAAVRAGVPIPKFLLRTGREITLEGHHPNVGAMR